LPQTFKYKHTRQWTTRAECLFARFFHAAHALAIAVIVAVGKAIPQSNSHRQKLWRERTYMNFFVRFQHRRKENIKCVLYIIRASRKFSSSLHKRPSGLPDGALLKEQNKRKSVGFKKFLKSNCWLILQIRTNIFFKLLEKVV